MNIDLGGGEADPRRLVHGLGHVGDQLANVISDGLHRLSVGVEAGIGVAKDG